LLAKRFAWSCLALFVGALLSLVAVDRSRYPAERKTADAQSAGAGWATKMGNP
jgi:hypothetical protein